MDSRLRDAIPLLKAEGIWWLAGYPRSGAALVRSILAHCFGLKTGSIYPEAFLGSGYIGAVNLWDMPQTSDDMVAMASDGALAIKTHELPEPGDCTPAIIIIRDGRRVLESLQAFYKENSRIDVSMESLIVGEHMWGCWSRWHRLWAMCSHSRTLWL